jgi:uncharacterized protein (TIGR02145 family)
VKGKSSSAEKDASSSSKKAGSSSSSSEGKSTEKSSSSLESCEELVARLLTEDVKYGTMTDERDGHVYKTLYVGDYMWMAENLAYGDSVQTPSLIYGHDCSDTNNGCAYKWGAAMDSIALIRDTVYKAKCGYRENNSLTCQLPPIVRGICPEGWHLPRRHEFTTMTNILSETELRSLLSNRVGQTDIPRYFWTPEIDVEEAWTMCLTGISYPPGFRTRPMNKKWYVRCVKDN